VTPLPDILNKHGHPAVNVPFTKAGRTFKVVGARQEGPKFIYSLQRLDELRENETLFIDVPSEKIISHRR
jgi:hypothetical protein